MKLIGVTGTKGKTTTTYLLKSILEKNGIKARKYFYPLTNEYECYRDYPTAGGEKTPTAAYYADRVLTLPMYADLSLQDVDRICEIIKEM